jgi:hypothetical protein
MALDMTSPAEAISEAATLFSGLITGLPSIPTFPEPPEVDIPDMPEMTAVDLSDEVTMPGVASLTDGAVAGDGVFDKLMSAVNAHIENQYSKGIIGKSEVANVYIAAIQAVLPQSIQFLVTGQEAYWRAKLLQLQAQNTLLERTRLEAELQTLRLNAFTAQAQAYAAQVGALTAQTQYANGKLSLVATLQAVNNGEMQEALTEQNYLAATLQTSNTLPGGGTPGGHASRDLEIKDEQLVTIGKQQALLDAQTNVQRAQTYDTNTDTTPVAGVIGTQKSLYEQQIESYQQDAKSKGVKMVADLWTSAKALDDSVASPGPLAGNLMMAINSYMNGLGLPNAMVSPDTPASGAPSDDSDWNTPGQQ